jgi:hypothetical protein
MSSRFGIDAAVAKKNITWYLHRPENKSLATIKEVLFLVTDRLGDAGAFLGSIGLTTRFLWMIQRITPIAID